MLGAIAGDVVGSVYEFINIKTTNFPLFSEESMFTDDSLMSIAVAMWLLKWGTRHPYNSYSNGSAMRASACGWYAQSIDDALYWGKRSAEVTHNHPEGIKGAQAVSTAIFLARHGASKTEIANFIEHQFEYDLHRTCDDIRPCYRHEASCMESVPQAIVAFMDSTDFESALRLSVSLGGDSDTLACITGGIAEAFYRSVPEHIANHVMDLLPEDYQVVVKRLQGLP